MYMGINSFFYGSITKIDENSTKLSLKIVAIEKQDKTYVGGF